MYRKSLLLVCLTAVTTVWSPAQLPPDSVQLDKVKIREIQKSEDLCPVYLVPSDPNLPEWTHNGIRYRGSRPDAREKFLQDPERYANAAARRRFVNNFMMTMSTIWCPVTDEVTPGGMLEWDRLGYKWESCCAFCDENAKEGDFEIALERLRKRAETSFALMGPRYTEGASSPVEGAIVRPGISEESPADNLEAPDYLKGVTPKATYAGGIGLIFEHRCVTCHRPGEVAPMSFMTLPEIRKWSRSMKNAIVTRTMPPWPADPAVGSFANSRRLTTAEVDLLKEWLDAGMPAGEGSYASRTEFVEGWSIGKPDAVFELPEHTVGEDLSGQIKEFVVETGFADDRWITAAEARPGNDMIVISIDGGPLGSYAVGDSYERYPAGTGVLLKAGSKVRVRVHYMKEKGFEATDQSRLGVKFSKNPREIQKGIEKVEMRAGDFTIPAGKADLEVTSRFTMPEQGQILSLMPLMNSRGKSVTLKAIHPDGREEPLLSIPRWEPQWRLRYQLKTPLDVAKGTVIVATARFDNSDANPKNPDPQADVSSGPEGEQLTTRISYLKNLR